MKGHIAKRSKGSYSIVLELGKDPSTGKRQQKWLTVNGTKKDAERELARRVNEVNIGTFADPGKITVSEFLEQWLKNYAEINVSGKTLERYRSIVTHHLRPAFGTLPLARLAPLHIQAHYSRALKNGRKDGRKGGLSPQSVLHHHRVLSEALSMAVRWQLLARNPAEAVEPPTVRRKEVQPIDETATAWLLDAALGTRLYIPIMLSVCSGLRRGEILGLKWQDLQWDSARLWIRRALEETKLKGVIFKEPKNKRGRSVALPLVAIEALRFHKHQQRGHREMLGSGYKDNDLICCVEDGSIWKPSAFTSAYRALLRRRKLNGPNFHAIRHAHASQLLKEGVDIKVISERLGHSKTSFTLDVYGHLLPGRDEEAARRVELTLRKAIEETRRPIA